MEIWLLEDRLRGMVREERSNMFTNKEEHDMMKKHNDDMMRLAWDRDYVPTFSITKEELLNQMWIDVFKALRESVDEQNDLYEGEVVYTPGLDDGTKKMIDTLHFQFYREVIDSYRDPRSAMVFGNLDRMLFNAKKWYDGWNDKRYKEYITFLTMHEVLYRTSLSGKPTQDELVKRMKDTLTVKTEYTDFFGNTVSYKEELDGWDIGEKQLRLIYKISDDRLLSLMYTFGYTLEQLFVMLPFLKNNEESKRLDVMASMTCGALHQTMTPGEILNHIVNSCETDDVYLEGYIERRNREMRDRRDLI